MTVDPRLAGLPDAGGTALVVAAGDWDVAGAWPGAALVHVPDWAPAEPFALPEGPADLVALVGVLRLVASPTSLLDAAFARLRPGGTLVVVEPVRMPASPAATRHLDALDLGAAIARARGWPHAPCFRRLQVGSVIQGYGLADLAFSPAEPADDAAPTLASARARTWAMRLAEAAADPALPPALRDRARAFDPLDLALAPAMRDWGRKPG